MMTYREALHWMRMSRRDVFKEIRTIIRPLGLDISENREYAWEDNPDAVAVYESGSVFEKTISIALNYCLIFKTVREDLKEFGEFCAPIEELTSAVEMSVWHELFHGLWEYLDDLLWNDKDVREKVYALSSASQLIYRFRFEEEECVEECAMACYEGRMDASLAGQLLEILCQI